MKDVNKTQKWLLLAWVFSGWMIYSGGFGEDIFIGIMISCSCGLFLFQDKK